jgi:acyl carrier protein
MDLDTIYLKLTTIMAEVFDDDALQPRPDMTADEVDGWDSLSHLRLVMTVQKAFGVKFSASEVGGMKNVGDLANLIRTKLG